jgi:hypothetical protein
MLQAIADGRWQDYRCHLPGSAFEYSLGRKRLDDVIGEYFSIDSVNKLHGYLWTASNDHFSSFDIPGATETSAGGLNDEGDIVGHFVNSDASYIAYELTPICPRN